MTQNEIDMLAVLDYLMSTKAPSDHAGAALKRLHAQLSPPVAVDNRPDGERRREQLEKAKGHPNPVNKGVLFTPPPVIPDSVTRREQLENAKKPYGGVR
jgi:hypothetical protein